MSSFLHCRNDISDAAFSSALKEVGNSLGTAWAPYRCVAGHLSCAGSARTPPFPIAKARRPTQLTRPLVASSGWTVTRKRLTMNVKVLNG